MSHLLIQIVKAMYLHCGICSYALGRQRSRRLHFQCARPHFETLTALCPGDLLNPADLPWIPLLSVASWPPIGMNTHSVSPSPAPIAFKVIKSESSVVDSTT